MDPINLLWDRLQDAFVETKENAGHELFGDDIKLQEWSKVKRPLNTIMNDLMNLPVHYIMCAHDASKYEEVKGKLKVTDSKAAGEKHTPFAADTVLEFLDQDEGGGTNALCRKDRTGVLKVGMRYKNLTFETWREYLNTSGPIPESEPQEEEEALKQDQALFQSTGMDEAGLVPEAQTSSLVEQLIGEPNCKKVLDKMDWPPAKRVAMAKKFEDMESWKKFLGEAARADRNEHPEKWAK
jgi:hypothetical protein